MHELAQPVESITLCIWPIPSPPHANPRQPKSSTPYPLTQISFSFLVYQNIHPLLFSSSTLLYSLLLSAPSFCIPSHPTRFPAACSTPPNPFPDSLSSLAAFIASTAWFLSCSPDVAQAWLPVTLPIVAWVVVVLVGDLTGEGKKCGKEEERGGEGGREAYFGGAFDVLGVAGDEAGVFHVVGAGGLCGHVGVCVCGDEIEIK